jgi:phosphatidate cytidylyltransferase
MSANLARRIAVAAVGIPAAVVLVRLGGWVLVAMIAVFAVAGAEEFYRLGERGGVRPFRVPGLVGAALLPIVAYLLIPGGAVLPPRTVALGAALWLIIVALWAVARRGPAERPLSSVAITVFGAAYAGGLPSFLLVIRHPQPDIAPWAGTALVFLPLIVTWASDTLAMAGGSAVGGPKLAPVLSPKKTWAGAVTGTAGAVILAPLLGRVMLAPVGVPLGILPLAVFGLVVSVVGQVGDVAESLYKREAGVKDSGGFFPGHGGVLDRFDSLYWALPVSAALLDAFGVI